MEPLLLRPEQAAEAIGVSWSRLYEMLARGELTSITVGRSRRVPVDALRHWLARRLDEQASVDERRAEPIAAGRRSGRGR